MKISNVLLEDNLNAKLFDFGLPLEIPLGETYVESLVKGTIGFVAPESVDTGKFNDKTDVFAICDTLIEILIGRAPGDVFIETSRDKFPNFTSCRVLSHVCFFTHKKRSFGVVKGESDKGREAKCFGGERRARYKMCGRIAREKAKD